MQTPYTERRLQVVLAIRALALMPICAWYVSTECDIHHNKQFLMHHAEECLQYSLHTFYRPLLLRGAKSGNGTPDGAIFSSPCLCARGSPKMGASDEKTD